MTTCRIMKSEHFLLPHKKKNKQTWIKNLNVSPETVKLLGENIGRTRTVFDINHSSMLLDLSPKAKEVKAKINK